MDVTVELSYPNPVLTDGRIGLRRWRHTDIECVRLAATDPRIPVGTTVPAVYTPEAGREFIDRQHQRLTTGEGISQAIVDADTDRAIGLLWLGIRPDGNIASLGYWVVPEARGRGAAGCAVRLIVPWALNVLGLQRLEAFVLPDNVASQQTLTRAGFELEGRLRNLLNIGGQIRDALVYSVVPPRS
jgi:ribosomal-protein-alanine N-acetyltransferase